MSDLMKSLNEFEKKLETIKTIAEQEKAMLEVFPLRFNSNMQAFQRLIPSIYHQFEKYVVTRELEFFCTENGEPNIRWKDNGHAFYSHSPYHDCSQQIQNILASTPIMQFERNHEHDAFGQEHILFFNKLTSVHHETYKKNEPTHGIPDSIPLAMMFGLGLGYQLAYLYERCQVANLFVFEPDADIFYASLYCFDWASLLSYLEQENMGLHLFVGQTENDVMTDLRAAISTEKNNTFLCANCFYFSHYDSPALSSLKATVLRDFYQLGMGWGFFDDNLFSLSHSLNNLCSGIRFIVKDKALPGGTASTPVLVVANGPSLDETAMEFIRQHQKGAIILACGTALGSLYRAGISADIYVATERVDVVPRSLENIPQEYLDKILFLATDVVHPDCQRIFKKIVLTMKADEPMLTLLLANHEPVDELLSITHANPLVGNIGISMPVHLGFKNLYLIGLDNGFKVSGHHHSKYSMYYDESGQPRPEFSAMVLASGDKIIPGNFGGEVISNNLFCASLMMIEVLLSNFRDVTCHNCSDGAMIRGVKPMPLQDVPVSTWNDLDKKSLLEHIHDDMSIQVNFDSSQLKKYMEQPFFNWFIDKLKQEWHNLPDSRYEFIRMLQKQAEYLQTIHNSRQRHIAYVLTGTLNTLYAMLSVFVYRLEDESIALSCVKEQVPLIQDFFDTLKRNYEYGMDMIQGPHRNLISSLSS